jgi:hypothetical protein
VNKNWGYKGRETAINGLTNWLDDNVALRRSTTDQRWEEYYKMIIAYAVVNIPGFIKRGQPRVQADYIAKKIDKNKKFNHFVDWIKSNYITTNTK